MRFSYHPASLIFSQEIMFQALYLEARGNLFLNDHYSSSRIKRSLIDREIEQFWVSNNNLDGIGNILWTYGRHGIKVCDNTILSDHPRRGTPSFAQRPAQLCLN